MFVLVGHMGEQLGGPLGRRQALEVAFQRRVECGEVEDPAGVAITGHLRQREGRADMQAGELLAALGVAGLHPDLIVDGRLQGWRRWGDFVNNPG